MNLPARPRSWPVHGESLSIEGSAADVIVDWIADDEDETDKRRINRLMGVKRSHFLSHWYSYLTFVLCSFPLVVNYRRSSSTLHQLRHPRNRLPRRRSTTCWIPFLAMTTCALNLGSNRMPSKFCLSFIYLFIYSLSLVFISNYIRHTESERTSDVNPIMSEEAEPNVVGYPAQHGIRKHGRWNNRPRNSHVNIYYMISFVTFFWVQLLSSYLIAFPGRRRGIPSAVIRLWPTHSFGYIRAGRARSVYRRVDTLPEDTTASRLEGSRLSGRRRRLWIQCRYTRQRLWR